MPDGSAPPVVARLELASFSRGGRAVLRDVTLTVHPGQTLALVGPSGIGKTTLLRIFAGLEDGFEGTLHVAGRMAVVFQEPALLPWRSLRDNICLPTGAPPDVAEAMLAEVGLAGRDGDYPGQLSLGQQRRVALARAFAVAPDLLLLDEPFVSLDAALVREMMDLFLRLRDRHGVATLFVTHDAGEASYLADRIVRLDGSPATVVPG
ncbi:ABC transporter ATP-binding protein [Pseudooceanicola onchidii]|uniref:ABC transporter ATP-binding protein n=1 Tax=Pseudooceanicola onchidii TaxID=2562279 RepID=UPI0010AAECD1|nr:ABC transporter ATP-binding protein [Pseudooceanicola onchidii]